MTVVDERAKLERVVQILAEDERVEREALLSEAGLEIGRSDAGLRCPDVRDLADCHARIAAVGDDFEISDSGEGSGVWLRLRSSNRRKLKAGDQIWLGTQILIVRRRGDDWEVDHHGPDGRLCESHVVPATGLFIGRTSDLVLDANDGRLSRRHAQLVIDEEGLSLYDRSAHNGTYLKLVGSERLSDGDEFRLARNQFRFVLRAADVASDLPHTQTADGFEGPTEPEAVVPLDPAVDPTIIDPGMAAGASFEATRRPLGLGARLRRLAHRQDRSDEGEGEGAGETAKGSPENVLVVLDSPEGSISLEARAGQTILEVVKAAGLARGEPVDWECGDGGCGVCVLGVVEGADRLDPPDPELAEMKTIQITEQVVPDPRQYRLACMARVRGTVRLRRLT
jgi:ferredoxin/pSer/pThr/pTyr-binding forkhead associated (FHA) protein